MDESITIIAKTKDILIPGKVDDEYFWMLINISTIHSNKVICALHDHLVFGYTKKESCERHNVSPSYLSISLKRIINISKITQSIYLYYSKL
ncbi:transcriptional regulator [Salmonella enterica]|nr:transcriptional regulator [Salmonella enterica]